MAQPGGAAGLRGVAPPGGHDVLTLAENHYGLAPADVQRLERMPVEWMQATFPVLMRLALRHELSINHLESAAFRHVQMPSKHEVILAMQLTAKYYGQEAARLRKDHAQEIQAGQVVAALEELGIPHPHVFLALIGALLAQGEKIGQRNHTALKEYEQTIKHEKPDNSKLADTILHCRMQTTHSGEFVKVWIAVEPKQIEQVIVDSLVQLGGKHKHGVPPRSHGARVMQLHLDGLENLNM